MEILANLGLGLQTALSLTNLLPVTFGLPPVRHRRDHRQPRARIVLTPALRKKCEEAFQEEGEAVLSGAKP